MSVTDFERRFHSVLSFFTTRGTPNPESKPWHLNAVGEFKLLSNVIDGHFFSLGVFNTDKS
jgi:hypothetical protein